MSVKITDLDIYTAPDANNPDGRLKDDVYSGTALVSAGSDAKADYMMEPLTLIYRLIRDNGDVPDGTPDNNVTSQAMDGLINKILETMQGPSSWGNFRVEIVPTSANDGGFRITHSSGRYIQLHNRGISFNNGIGTAVWMTNEIEIDISAVSWSLSSNGHYFNTALSINTGLPWNSAYRQHMASVSIKDDTNPAVTKLIAAPATIYTEESGGDVIITRIYVWSILSPSASGMSAQKLFVRFDGRGL